MMCAKRAIGASSSSVTLLLTWRHFRSPDNRRSDMTNSTLRFGVPLAIALAMASAAVVAEPTQQTPADETGKVEQTFVRLSYTGIPIEQTQVDLPVSYANLDLTTSSGAAELKSRVADAARKACERVDAADPVDFMDTDDFSCVREATKGALKQVNAAIAAAQTNNVAGATRVSLNK
jgi:UrcA family protein